MRLPKNILSNTFRKPDVYLCEVDKTRICKLDTSNMQASLKFNSYSELSFEVGRTYNDILTGATEINPYYDLIEALRLIYVEGFGYFEIQGPELVGDGIKEAKSITTYSYEYTLSQKYLEDFYVNTGETNSIEVINASSENNIVPVTLYNPNNKKLSLLHLILEKDYAGWTIGHVDTQLQTLSRQFEVDRKSIYDFIMNEVCEKFNCYAVFDTINNTINLYAESPTEKFIGDSKTKTYTCKNSFSAIHTVSINGYKTTKWSYSNGILTLEDTPESGAIIEVVGEDSTWETDVFVTFDNLSQEIKVNYDADSIKTVLTVTFGDDNDIREVNLGLPYIVDLSYYCTPEWMGQDLYDDWLAYQQKCNSKQTEYTKNTQDMLYYAGQIDYEENRLSLGYAEITVDENSVGKYYVRGGTYPNYYYTEVSLPAEYDANVVYYSMDTTNLNEEKVANLLTALKQYFNKEETWGDEINKLSRDFQFMDIYTLGYLSNALKNAQTTEQADMAVNNFLGEMWQQIGRTPLKTLYYDPYKKVQATNIEAGWSQTSDDNYWYYYPVVLLLNSISSAISKRDAVIAKYEEQYVAIQRKNANISDALLMDNNFTKQQLVRLSAFLREDELHLDDIIETDQDTVADSFKIKQDAMESARIELQKLCQPQLQFSMSMANIYALPEFEPIIDQFQLGNVIKVGLRSDYIKQSRLLQVDINFDDFSDFSCEFGELTSLRSQSDIHADLLSQAISAGKSVATNASYWTKGSDRAGLIEQKIDAGLLDAVTSIKSIDGTQGVSVDAYGIHLQNINPNTGEPDPEQGWIINNKFLYTDDGFKTTKAVFGKYNYDGNSYYGILAEALVGKMIVGTNIEIGNADGTLKFNDEGFSITNGGTTFQIDPNSKQLINLSNGTEDLFYIGEDGRLHVIGDGKGLDISANTSIAEIKQTEEEIKLSVKEEEQRAISAENGLQTSINTANAQITLNKDAIMTEVEKREEINNDLYSKIDAANTKIDQTADDIVLSANNLQKYVDDNYSTTNEMNAAIKLSADSITSEVNRVEKDINDNYSTTAETQSLIKQEADKITSTVAQNIENIQIGARNILQRTNINKYSVEWKTWNSSLWVNTNGYLRITPSESVTSAGAYPPKLSTLEANTEYTLSFEAYASIPITLNYIYIMADAGNTSLRASVAISNVSKKYSYTFTTNKAYSNCSVMIGYSNSSGVSSQFYLKNLKLEKGNKATDWTPAPEDDEAAIENLSSKITQTASEIRSEVSATYATKSTLENYPTTTEMNSAISQSASGITSAVNQQLTGYATVGQTRHYGTCATAASTAAKVVTCSGFTLYTGATISVNFTYKNSAAAPTLNVNSTGAKYIRAYNSDLTADSNYNWAARAVVTFVYDGTYWRLSDSGALYQTANLSSRITQTAESIEAEVTRATRAESDLSSKITINANAITSKVSSGDFGTLIEQNHDHIKIAWNKNSNYIQFESGAMCIYTSSTHNTNTLLMKQTYDGVWYYRGGKKLGCIGTNNFVEDSNFRGIVFDLEYDGNYMCWAAKDSSDANSYTVKMIYYNKDTPVHKKGLHFDCATYAGGKLYLTDTNRFIAWGDGGCGFNGKMTWCNSSNTNAVMIDGAAKQFAIYNGVDADIYTNLDMHSWSILNQSDARLKNNIQDTKIDALSAINQIEIKEFDWIESGEHEDVGIIAQQLQDVLPDLVYKNSSTGKLSIKINKFIPYLIKSIQELTDYITGGASTFSLNRGWVDPYTDEEKATFVANNLCYNKNESSEELQKPAILIPIETQEGEEKENEQQ